MSDANVFEQQGWCVERFTCPTIPKGKDWEAFRGIITYLYQERDHRLQDVIDVMLREFNFRATKRMYTQRFRDWNVIKNIGQNDVQEYLQRPRHPTKLASDGTLSVMLRGRTVKKERLLSYMRRREIIPEARLDEAAVTEDHGTRGYEDFESDHEADEVQDGLNSEELTSLQIAMLQTDFHYRQTDEDNPTEIQGEIEKQNRYPLAKLSPPQLLAGPQELIDLEFVLHNSNIAYAQFPKAKYRPSPEPLQLSAKQRGQAKDFYARHWLAISLFPKTCDKETFQIVRELLAQTGEQVKPVLSENHPHFLPWIAYVISFSGGLKRLQYTVLNFTLEMSELLLQNNDPRMQIQQRLATSKFRKSICLVLLRQVISFFRREIQQSHLEALELLARLFDNIDAQDKFDGAMVEETLQKWAQSSLTLATLIGEDQKLARQKAARQSFDPVRQAASYNNTDPKLDQ